MKFSVAALVVVLALTHGIESSTLVKRDTTADLEKISKYFQDLSAMLSSTAQDLAEKIKAHELAGQAQTYLDDGKEKLTPLAEKLQEQIKPLADSVQAQLKPLADSMQAQLQPLADSVQTQLEDLWKMVQEQTKALAPAK